MNTAEAIADLLERGFEWPIPVEAVTLVARKEGCRLKAYRCIAGVPTIGWGETDGIRMGMVWTKQQADERFFQEVCEFTAKVVVLVNEHTPQQLGAMVSLAYNIGLGAFAKSSILRAHNQRRFDAAARAFTLWNKARVNGVLQEVSGLTARRLEESALYLSEDADEAPRLPQDIVPESSLAKSPIQISAAATIATGTATLALPAIDQIVPAVETAKTVATTLNINPAVVFAVVLIVAGAVIAYNRYKQRSEGWA